MDPFASGSQASSGTLVITKGSSRCRSQVVSTGGVTKVQAGKCSTAVRSLLRGGSNFLPDRYYTLPALGTQTPSSIPWNGRKLDLGFKRTCSRLNNMMLKLSSVQPIKILGKKATTYISGHKNDRELLFRLRRSNQMIFYFVI